MRVKNKQVHTQRKPGNIVNSRRPGALTSRVTSIALACLVVVAMLAVPGVAVADEVVTFPDANLEAAIRDAIPKPTGDIYQSDLDGLTELVTGARNGNSTWARAAFGGNRWSVITLQKKGFPDSLYRRRKPDENSN